MKKNFQRRLSQIFGLDSINENERKLLKMTFDKTEKNNLELSGERKQGGKGSDETCSASSTQKGNYTVTNPTTCRHTVDVRSLCSEGLIPFFCPNPTTAFQFFVFK